MAYHDEHDILPVARPIQIVSPDNNHAFIPQNLYTVARILLSDELRDREIVVVSIAGALRKGKSFLLNYFLRYLNARYKKNNVEDWIGRNETDNTLNGFTWRGGKDRETVGIWMWSEVFTHDFSEDNKVAIILIDTQGIFDNQSSLKECISIFAISMLLSSVQCYNVMSQMQEDDLTNLHLFTEYARFVKEKDAMGKPFQKLLFIVRDWPSPEDNAFGSSDEYVKDILEKKEKQTTEMHELRDAIKNSFGEIGSFLMPYPGNDVAQQRKRSPNQIKIESDFTDCIEQLTVQLLAPENLIRKQICGETVKALELVGYLNKYIKTFSGKELPEPVSILQATAETHLKKCVIECIEDYINDMEEAVDGADVYCSENDLLQKHINAKEKAVKRFNNRPKLGNLDVQRDYSKSLQKDIEKGYAEVRDMNKSLRDNVESKKSTIFASVAIGATVVGAIGSVILGGPLGLGLFATFAEAGPAVLGGLAAGGAAGGGLGGLGIGAGTKKWFPRKWFGEESALKKKIKRIKKSLKDQFNAESDDSMLPDDSSAMSESTVSPPSDVQIMPIKNEATSNNDAPERLNNTVTLSDHTESTQNSTASISGNMIPDATTSNRTNVVSDHAVPTNRAEADDVGRTDYFYLPKLAVNTVRSFFSNFRLR